MEISVSDGYDGIKLINSPRSLEACEKQGIAAEELQFKPLEYFQ
jgi:hypothetical protein